MALQRQRDDLVNQFMQLNLKEVGAFIPVYEEYRTEMGKLSVFYRFTVRFRTCSESVVVISRPFIIDSSEPGLLSIGER